MVAGVTDHKRSRAIAAPPFGGTLARTTALAFGYLPARGIALPAGLTWLHTVIRTGVTPVLLLGTAVLLVVVLRSGGRERIAP